LLGRQLNILLGQFLGHVTECDIFFYGKGVFPEILEYDAEKIVILRVVYNKRDQDKILKSIER
jgi:hypothetical protein